MTDQQPQHNNSQNIAQAIQEVSERAQLLVREEIELAKAEVSQKVAKLVKGAVVGIAAGVFVIVGLFLLLEGLAWLAYWAIPFPDGTFFWGFFVVAGALFLFGALAGFMAARAFKRAAPPTPDMAIDEAKRIRETVQSSRPEQTV
jgi:tetrahydromethanopterin S-methyltransferase subunit G